LLAGIGKQNLVAGIGGSGRVHLCAPPGSAPEESRVRRFGSKAGLLGFAATLPIAVAFGLKPSSALQSQVRPEREAAITREQATFPHGKPKHQTIGCSKCHTIAPGTIDETRFTGHESCLGCHNLAAEDILRPVTFCGICHNGRAFSKQQPALFKYPKVAGSTDFGIGFSHPSHLKPRLQTGFNPASLNNPLLNLSVLGGDTPSCGDCHRPNDPVGPNKAEMNTATGHPSCFVCHGDHPLARPAMSECAECHRLNGPRYPHYYGTVKDFKHPDHVYDTRPIIKAEVRFPRRPDYLCSECHQSAASAASLNEIRLPQQNYCNQCHNGRLGLPDPLSKEVIDSLGRR
jgi:hypothetical protein